MSTEQQSRPVTKMMIIAELRRLKEEEGSLHSDYEGGACAIVGFEARIAEDFHVYFTSADFERDSDGSIRDFDGGGFFRVYVLEKKFLAIDTQNSEIHGDWWCHEDIPDGEDAGDNIEEELQSAFDECVYCSDCYKDESYGDIEDYLKDPLQIAESLHHLDAQALYSRPDGDINEPVVYAKPIDFVLPEGQPDPFEGMNEISDWDAAFLLENKIPYE